MPTKNVEYTRDELTDARMTNPELRNARQKAIITTYKREIYWKNYRKEKEENKTYAIKLPAPWDAIDIKRDPVYYTTKERREARATPINERTERQIAILRTYNNRRYYAYMRRHSTVPKWSQHITRILTDIDNVEDILATASYAFFAAGIIVPLAAPILEAIGGILQAATIPMNLAEAVLGLGTGPMGAKRAFEALVRLTPLGKILKVENVGLLKDMENKVFTSGMMRRLALRTGEDISKIAKKIALKDRLKYAMPRWGTLLEAGQAAQNITGTGLILGPFYGAASELTFAGYRIVNGHKVKIYMPWEKPDIATRIAAHGLTSTSRLITKKGILTPEQQIKTMLVRAYCTQKMQDYWKDKDLSPYIKYIAENDTDTNQDATPASIDAAESVGIQLNNKDGSYLSAEAQTEKDITTRFEAKTIQEEMQAILQRKDKALKEIIDTHKGYMSEQVIGEAITKQAETTANTLTKKGSNVQQELRADFKVMLAMLKHNILPFAGIDYGCGIEGAAFGFTINYSKKEVLKTLNKVKTITINKIKGYYAKGNDYLTLKEYYNYWYKTQRLPKDYAKQYEIDTGIKINLNIDREEKYYSWYFDIWDYWRKELIKINRLYVTGNMELTPKDILKHLAFPEPDLYNNKTGKTTHKKLNWVFATQWGIENFKGTTETIEPTYKLMENLNISKYDDYLYIGVADDLLERYLTPGTSGWTLLTNKISPKEKNYNKLLEHTLNAILSIGGWDTISGIDVFNTVITDEEIIKKKKRLIGSNSQVAFFSNYFLSKQENGYGIYNQLPFNMLFYTYNKPPVFIMKPQEKEIFTNANIAPPIWWNYASIRNIFHKYLVTRPYNYEYKNKEISLDDIKEMYIEMQEEGIELQSWPEKTEKKLRETGRTQGTLNTKAANTRTPTTPQEKEIKTSPKIEIKIVTMPNTRPNATTKIKPYIQIKQRKVKYTHPEQELFNIETRKIKINNKTIYIPGNISSGVTGNRSNIYID